MEIGFFSTDFASEPVPDQPGQQMVTFGGTFYYRGAMPGMELTKHGYDCHLSWRFRTAPDGHIQTMDTEGNWHDPDIFYQQRWMKDDGAKVFNRAKATGQTIVGDLDDDFWALTKTNLAYHTTDPKNNPEFNRVHYWENLKACSAITVSTEALRKRVQKTNVPTFILRNAIDLERWQPNDPTRDDGVIGWVGGIQWRAHDLEILRTVGLPQFLLDYELPVYHGGHSKVPGVPPFWEKVGIDPTKTKIIVSDLCNIAQYPLLWRPLNVSLVPLEAVYFNQAKSYLKALESCAAGIPYVVSDGLAEQNILIDEGSAGRVARNWKPSDWIGHLTDLLDPEVRATEGKINRGVAENHDIAVRWADWDEVYRQLV